MRNGKRARLTIIILSCVCVLLLSLLISPLHEYIPGNPDSSGSQKSMQLLQEAYDVAEAVVAGDYAGLSRYVSDKGLLLVPFSTVEFDRNLLFTSSEVRSFAALKNKYIFGADPVTSQPIEMTVAEYMNAFLRTSDYTAAPMLGVNTVLKRGNAVENVAEAFPDGIFVDFFFPPSQSGGIDWSSLKVVFEVTNGRYHLVALIRSVYTEQ